MRRAVHLWERVAVRSQPIRDQRIREQVVVKILAVTPEQSLKVVKFSFGHAEHGYIDRIASVAGARRHQSVEERIFHLSYRMHFQRFTVNARAALQIDQRGIHRVAACVFGNMTAKIVSLMNRVSVLDDLLWLGCSFLGGRCRLIWLGCSFLCWSCRLLWWTCLLCG